MTVGLLLGSSSSVWAEQTSSTSDYLKNMNQLYEFAWSLQYTQEGPYDIWLVHDEQGITKSQSNFPQSVLDKKSACPRQKNKFSNNSSPFFEIIASTNDNALKNSV